MPTPAEDGKLSEIIHELQNATLGGNAVAAVLPRLRRLLDADRAAAHKLVRTDKGFKMEFVFLEGFPSGAEKTMRDWLATAPADAFNYDPSWVVEEQRNIVLRTRAALASDQLARMPVVRELFPKVGLAGMDQVRVLICEGPKLLAWVGAFRTRSFTPVEEIHLQALVPALVSRLQLENGIFR